MSKFKTSASGIDEKLNFKHRVDTLVSESRQKIGLPYRNRASFPRLYRKRIIEVVFLSVLDYGDVIYRHAASSTLKHLDSIYHSALLFYYW